MVIPAEGFDLDVFTGHVEPHGAGGFDVIPEGLVGGGGVESVGPPTLVEGTQLEEDLVVEEEAVDAAFVFGDGDFAHAEIAFDLIEGLAAAREGYGQVVEEGRIGRPELGVFDGDVEGGAGLSHAAGDGGVAVQRHGHDFIAGGGAVHGGRQTQHALVNVGGQGQVRNVGAGDGFEPDRLPDAGDGGVPDALGFEDLFAAGLVTRVGGVPDRDDKFLGALRNQRAGDVETERVVSALVAPAERAVHEDGAFPVDRVEMKEEALSVEVSGGGKAAAVPEALVRLHGLLDAGEGGFDGEWHQDLAFPGSGHGFGRAGGDGVIPEAVEVLPLVAGHLRPRIFGPDTLGRDIFGPAGHELAFDGFPLGHGGASQGDGEDEGDGDGSGRVHDAFSPT